MATRGVTSAVHAVSAWVVVAVALAQASGTPAATASPPTADYATDAVLAFHFDGDTADAAGNSPPLTSTAAPAFVAGMFGTRALVVSGPVFTSPPLGVLPSGNAPFTIALWVLGFPQTCCDVAVAIWGGPPGCCVVPVGDGTLTIVMLAGLELMRLGVVWGANSNILDPSDVPFDGRFRHVAATYDPALGRVSLFVNGALADARWRHDEHRRGVAAGPRRLAAVP